MQTPNPFLINGRPPGPVARFLAGIVALGVLAVSILLGFVFFVSALIAAAIIAIVVWFKTRQPGSAARGSQSRGAPSPGSPFRREPKSGTTLEGDFEVLDPEDSRRDGPGP